MYFHDQLGILRSKTIRFPRPAYLVVEGVPDEVGPVPVNMCEVSFPQARRSLPPMTYDFEPEVKFHRMPIIYSMQPWLAGRYAQSYVGDPSPTFSTTLTPKSANFVYSFRDLKKE